ncbi:MAG TPA: AI-2E family transporter [Polyangia bacterium]|nr:AI-2E family transporter [Polyangia bacterium]
MSPLSPRSRNGSNAGASWYAGASTPGRRGEARRFFQMNLAVLGVASCFALVYRFVNALFILFVGIAIGMAVKPGVEWLRRRGVPRSVGALGIYLALAGAFGGAALLVSPAITDGMSALVARGPKQLESLRAEMARSQSSTLRHLAQARLPTPAPSKLQATTVVTYGGVLGRNLGAVAAVLVLGFYWTLEGDRRARVLALFAPFERRRAILAFIAEVERTVGAYLRGQSLVCVAIGLMAFGIYRAMGLPHATALGLLYAIGEAVPVVGPIVGTAAAAVVALSVKPALVLWVACAAAFLQLAENYVLVPRLMGRTVGVSPLVTLLAIAAFGSTLGVAGAVLAIPIAAIVQLLLYRFLLGSEARAGDPPVGRGPLSVVRYEIHELTRDVRKRLSVTDDRAATERIEDAIEGIAYDLDRLLADREGRP